MFYKQRQSSDPVLMPRERNGGGESEFFTHPRYVSLSEDMVNIIEG